MLLTAEDETWMGSCWTFLEEKGYSFSVYLDKIPANKEERKILIGHCRQRIILSMECFAHYQGT